MLPPPYPALLRALSSLPRLTCGRCALSPGILMYRLNALGTLEIDGLNAAEAGAMLAQPKRLALLLYLAIEQPGGWQRRDTLLGLLWGDLDESRARNALSQALHHLRRGLGAETLPGQGIDLVRVEPEYLPCD